MHDRRMFWRIRRIPGGDLARYHVLFSHFPSLAQPWSVKNELSLLCGAMQGPNAAFSKESRMKFAETTKLDRNPEV